jgi:peptidyl-Lys metalloendopeptidase
MRSSVRVAAVALLLSGCAIDDDGTAAEPTPSDTSFALTSRIDVLNDWLGENDEVEIRWTLSNDSAQTVWLPRWQAPDATLTEDIFDVRVDGASVTYTGRHYKRAAPTAADMVAIAPGQAMTAVLPLSQYYRMHGAGEYAIQQRAMIEEAVSASNAVVAIRFEEAPEAVRPVARIVSPGFVSCSSSEKNKINSALSSASSYANNASAYVNAGKHNARYTTWFGTYTSSRFGKVQSHYTSIKGALDNKKIVVNCDCDESAYAYVYPDSPYEIYVCDAFWSASTTGTDSKAGTLIHELSHFNVVASTDDWTYGQSSCKSLAQSSPSKAVDNADSHEYFAENTPAQN